MKTGRPPDNDVASLKEKLRILREASALIAASQDFRQTLANTVSACLPVLGDFGFFDVRVGQQVIRTVRAHDNTDIEALLAPTQWVKQECTDMTLCALSTGMRAVHNGIDDEWYRKAAVGDGHLALLRQLAFHSMLTVPMRFRDELIGSLTLFMGSSGRSYSDEDVEFAEELAALAAPLVANVMLFEKQKQSESQLRASEERLRLAAGAGDLGIWEWDIRNDRITWSDTLLRLHGVEPGRFGGTLNDFNKLIHPQDLDSVSKKLEHALEGQANFSVDYRIALATGEVRWFVRWGHISRDEGGNAIGAVGAVQDVTAQKRAEERLRLLDTLSQATRDAVNAKEIMGITTRLLGEHLGATRCAYADVEPDNDEFTIRDDWNADGTLSSTGVYSLNLFGPRAAADLRAGRTLIIHDVDKELAPDEGADTFNALGIKAIITRPLVKGGKLTAMMAVHQSRPRRWSEADVGLVEEVVERSWAHIERVRAMELVQESEAHLASLLEQTAVGIAETDLTGCILRTNDRYCEIVQRSREEVVGHYMQEFTHPDDLPRNLVLFEKAVREGTPFEIEKRYVRPDGSNVWVNNTVSFIRRTGDESHSTILAVVLDISARKHAEEELRKADRRKDEFLAMLAHELRNPLAPISAAADILTVANLDPQRVKTTSNVIKRQVRHMTSLVDDLLDVSRVTRGLVKLDMAPLDAKTIVSDALEQVRPLIEEKRHHLGIELTPEAAHVVGDQKRLVQVLANLLNNAAKYTPIGGSIVLHTEIDKDQVVLHVADNGIGIDKELQPYVFDLFAQAKRSSDRSQGGLGIGLALVRSLVELHGGTVSCFSEGPGKGSRFSVRLPRLSQADEVRDFAARAAPANHAGRPLRILVVDDNADAAGMLAMFLETLEHQVFVEHESRRALERARIEQVDVCLLDIGLPGMDGYELARRLRAQPQTAHALLVAITGYGQDQDKQAAHDAGFDYHFAKPVDTAALTELLRDTESRLAKTKPN